MGDGEHLGTHRPPSTFGATVHPITGTAAPRIRLSRDANGITAVVLGVEMVARGCADARALRLDEHLR